MVLRWIHKTWTVFWRLVLAVLLLALVLSGAVVGLLQVEKVQEYLADRLEHRVEQDYYANLSIGDIDGVLPFSLALKEVVLTSTNTTAPDTLATVERVETEVDLWSLLQNRINITSFSMEQPRFWLNIDEEQQIHFLKKKEKALTGSGQKQKASWFGQTDVLAPVVRFSGGEINVQSTASEGPWLNFPSSFKLTDASADLFLEWSDQQRFLDIESFSAKASNLAMDSLAFSGQVYRGDQQLELNSFRLTLGDSRFTINGEIDGIQWSQPDFLGQLREAHYNLDLASKEVHTTDLQNFYSFVPELEQEFHLALNTEGPLDSLQVRQALLGTGESSVQLQGSLRNIAHGAPVAYNLQFRSDTLREQDLEPILNTLRLPPRPVHELLVEGQLSGTADSASTILKVSAPYGRLKIDATARVKAPYKYSGTVEGENLNLHSFLPATVDSSVLNVEGEFQGEGFSLRESEGKVLLTVTNSKVNGRAVNNLEMNTRLQKGIWQQFYKYRHENAFLQGEARVNFNKERPPVKINGSAENINLARIFPSAAVATTALDFNYNVETQGINLDQIQGRANVDVQPSVFNGDTVRAHQMYMDLNSSEAEVRSFRLTSSLFDMNVSGRILPSHIVEQARYWAKYLRNRFQAEILLNDPIDSLNGQAMPTEKVVFNGSVSTKDLSLIRNYFPGFPALSSESEIAFDVNTNGQRLLLSAEVLADSLSYRQWQIGDGDAQLTASFRSDRTLKEYATVDLETNIGSLRNEDVRFERMGLDVSLNQDELHYDQKIGSISDNARFNLELNSVLSDSSIQIAVSQFFLGNNEYAWINRRTPSLTFMEDDDVVLDDFRFQNRSEYFEVSGTLSADRQDSLMYDINNVHLNRISDLIDGKITFGGILDGTLVTKSLTQQPTVQGELQASRFTLNDRIVGDISFNSQFNPKRDRFDTRIAVTTDSVKYSSYLEENDQIGQNMYLEGYFVTPRPNAEQDTVFYFDTRFEQIDMWVIPLFVDNIFAEMEGQASGNGYITGNLEDFDFHAEFQTQNVFTKPRFVETNYFVSGPVQVDRQEGVTLDSLQVMDTKGGSGTVWGNIDLNNFNPITYLDISADLNQLQFLNNSYDPDIPFYGNISGTGLVRLTGSNTDLYLRTENPMQLTNSSNVSIPLMEQTELNQSEGFIRFVDSFDNFEQYSAAQAPTQGQEENLTEEQLEAEIQGMTFSERFDLDLQFTTSEEINVRLIFDPVTGEILNSQGTGQIRLTMQDQDVQMYGRYRINSGSYQFVTGEIISRKLQLEPGGTIVWEGEPDNARLDISAVYNARPNISTLTAEGPVEGQTQSGQQVPIDLIVEINGTLNSVENNYFFRLPPSLDLSSSSTLSYTINQINRDEQQKLLQATSILFTGQFLPTQGAGNATATLGENLSKGTTVLNPLLSNQVISPLLSNQINALLNSDVSRLDVDFNLNAYNEIDLGIALRLYNDRLVLRREGQITGGGPQSTLSDRIGDINATYRIHRGLSLTAFHRQDQILGSYGATGAQAGDVTPNVDGIGLEAQVQFNSWKGLKSKISNIFGHKNNNHNTGNTDALTKQKAIEEK